MRLRIITAILLALPPAAVYADIFKLAVPRESGLRFMWWPVLPIPTGWLHDEDISRESGTNMLLPKGHTFANAPALIYARADFKPRMPGTRSLAEYIANDKKALSAESGATVITDAPSVKTADGKALRIVSYVILSRKQWELAAYGEEGEFYLTFVLSASSEAALKADRPAFYGMLSAYRERP